MQQLVLGTAQLGMNYGIHNSSGKPSLNEAFKILDAAYENGINIIDTAPAYGDSEKVIGKYIQEKNRKFQIVTKLPKLDRGVKIEEQIRFYIENSISNLNINKIDYYLIHSFQDLKELPELTYNLHKAKQVGKINHIGVSIYEVNELNYILENCSEFIDVVQIPFNIFDLRWIKSDVLDKAKEKGISISVRSIFLQGLFFADEDKANKIHEHCYKYIYDLNEFAIKQGSSLESILLGFIRYYKDIDYILAGCETKEQLISNVKNFNSAFRFDHCKMNKIFDMYIDVEEDIVDPRRWKLV